MPYDKRFEMMKALQEDYEKSFPHHCRKCQGWGGKWVNYDPSPVGISLSPGYMTEFEDCPACTDQGKCPRCGALAFLYDEDEDVETCRGCGFVLGQSDGCPQP